MTKVSADSEKARTERTFLGPILEPALRYRLIAASRIIWFEVPGS